MKQLKDVLIFAPLEADLIVQHLRAVEPWFDRACEPACCGIRRAEHNKDTINSEHDMQTTHNELYSCKSESLSIVVTEPLGMYCIIQNGLIVHKQGNGWDVH